MITISDYTTATILVVVIIFLHIFFRWKGDVAGTNSSIGIVTRLKKLKEIVRTSKLSDIGKAHGNFVKNLNKKDYDLFKFLGSIKLSIGKQSISKSSFKLQEIIKKCRLSISGSVIDLCAGRGGWDSVIAGSPNVSRVTAVTLGARPGFEGHENYTEKYFTGKEKVTVRYDNILNLAPTDYDWVLFDGGEERSDKVKEADDFFELFHKGVFPHINENTNFVLKVLTPTDPRIIFDLEEIQRITGKGNLIRSTFSKATNLELYFVSVKPIGNVRNIARSLICENIAKLEMDAQIPTVKEQTEWKVIREPVLPTVDRAETLQILKPLEMSRSINQLAKYKVLDKSTWYAHWNTLGTYAFGNTGTNTITRVQKAYLFIRHLIPSLPGYDLWKTTDTTPKGFQEIFREKVDKAPKENTEYDVSRWIIYKAMAKYFLDRGLHYRELTWDEVVKQLNPKGVASIMDENVNEIREYVKDPNWVKKVELVRKHLEEGTPSYAIFTTIGKREKKKTPKKSKGSRMVAFLPIPMRLLELKLFGWFAIVTKPSYNHMGVGGLGLHDNGMRLKEQWREEASSSDIAGFDTKISVKTLSMEFDFMKRLGCGSKAAFNMYRIYANPHILVPKISEFTRMELLEGRGQRMSGTQPTYNMNTITRQNLVIQQYAVSQKWNSEDLFDKVMELMKKKEFTACISGDDEVSLGTKQQIKEYAENGKILNEIGFVRKDTYASSPSKIHRNIEEIEFCSHHYERVTYFDSSSGRKTYRYMPTRDVEEIVAKSSLRVGGDGLDTLESDAWISMQGNNLLVLYHHLRLPRLLGKIYKSTTPANLILTGMGATFLNKPWMREGDTLDVINTVLFGNSTAYPVKDFKVREIGHLGYLDMNRNRIYDNFEGTLTRKNCKNNLMKHVEMFVSRAEWVLDTGFLGKLI